jgi:hypothetical protein
MNARPIARIFISYSRKDGAEAAAQLRRDLETRGFSIWQDLIALEGGRDWWSQIEAALKSKDLWHFVLVVTPKALESSDARREIRLARQEGKTLLPVRGAPLNNLSTLPRWIGQIIDLSLPEHWRTFERVLEVPNSSKRVPMMAPEPPPDFVPRPIEFESLKGQLLDAKHDAIGITAALRGAGGYGKTTLAKALAHDSNVQDAYFDGVLWVELGERGGDRVLALISDLVTLIEGQARVMTTTEAARAALAEALGDRRILLVVDDVWNRAHLDPFLHGARNTTRLITTRFDRELPETAVRQRVDAMRSNEALALLSCELPRDQISTLAEPMGKLTTRLGEWAQLLKLANGFLRDRVCKHRMSLKRAIADLNNRFDARGFTALDDAKVRDYDTRHRSVSAVIRTSLELLNDDERARFGELGIFPEDADIPIGIVARLWSETGGLDRMAVEDLLIQLYSLSLLLALNLDDDSLRLHDTMRKFLQDQAGRDGLAKQHRQLILAMEDIRCNRETPSAEVRYYYSSLPEHLVKANDEETLGRLLLDPNWLNSKLKITDDPRSLAADFQRMQHRNTEWELIGKTIELTMNILAGDPRQLFPQILGRIAPDAAMPILTEFLDRSDPIQAVITRPSPCGILERSSL